MAITDEQQDWLASLEPDAVTPSDKGALRAILVSHPDLTADQRATVHDLLGPPPPPVTLDPTASRINGGKGSPAFQREQAARREASIRRGQERAASHPSVRRHVIQDNSLVIPKEGQP